MKLFGNSSARNGQEELQEQGLLTSDGQPETEYDREAEVAEDARIFRRNGLIISVSALLTILVVVGIGALIVNYFLNMINYQAASSNYFPTVATPEELPEEEAINERLEAIDEAEAGLEATPEELAQWDEHIESVVSDKETYEVPISQDVYNILLIGSDTRERGEVGRSDAMILVSINQKTQTIYLTSFLRDCYVYVPGWGNTRLNHAFAYEGPDLLEQTLEENFKVHVDRYVAVDFFSFMDVIDILDGVWINVSEEERLITDDYIWSMNKLMDQEWSTDYLWHSGWQKLNGKQALCYARNRYTGNDFDRTQRQRNIISQILAAARQASAAKLVELAQVILPQVTTDLTKTQILSYAANAGAYANYEVVSQQIPAADTYYGATIDGMSVISLDLDENISRIQGTIYAGTEYGFPIKEVQTSADYGEGTIDWDNVDFENYNPEEFWGRPEWSEIEWERVDWDQVDWYHINFDTVDWTSYYRPEEEEPSPSATASPRVSTKPSATAKPTATAKPSAAPQPAGTPAASAIPAPGTAAPSATARPASNLRPTGTPEIKAPEEQGDEE